MEIDRTRERVARMILESGPSTAGWLSDQLEVTPAAVRRHLDALVEDGVLQAREVRASRRGRGRPAKEFVLTSAGHDRFEKAYDDLAAQALRFLAEAQGDEAVTAFARHRLQGLEERVAQLRSVSPDLTAVQALAEAMNEAGFAASVREGPVGEQLCQQHCPVAHVAHEFPQLCDAETEMISRVVGHHVQRLATIAHGDGVCTTCIPGSANDSGSVSSAAEKLTRFTPTHSNRRPTAERQAR